MVGKDIIGKNQEFGFRFVMFGISLGYLLNIFRGWVYKNKFQSIQFEQMVFKTMGTNEISGDLRGREKKRFEGRFTRTDNPSLILTVPPHRRAHSTLSS